jgi:uncharacterized protein
MDVHSVTVHRPARGVKWQPWSAAAFARARDEGRPVLLLLTVPWSEGSAALERALAEDGPLAEVVNHSFVPVRVDAERRPDISDRYDAGGWPTVAFLTPDGDVLTADARTDEDGLRRLCIRVADAYRGRRPASSAAARGPTPRMSGAQLTRPDPIVAFVGAAREEFDETHAGFGTGPKFPHAAALRALLNYVSGRRGAHDTRVREITRRSLDAIDALHDPAEGGVFRHARSRDWSDSVREKLLDDQAALLDVYVVAAKVLDEHRYLARAADIVRFVTTRLAQPEGGFSGSATPDAIDQTLYVDSNARIATALLHVAQASHDEALARTAVSGLERVLLAAYRPSEGAAHWVDPDGSVGRERLLADQVAVAETMLTAHEVGHDDTHLMMAEELMLGALRRHWHAAGWSFRDVPADGEAIAALATPRYPVATNADAARVLTTLAERTGKSEYRMRALDILRAFALTSHDERLLAAPYICAMQALDANA